LKLQHGRIAAKLDKVRQSNKTHEKLANTKKLA
jgi:hypothetical protein